MPSAPICGSPRKPGPPPDMDAKALRLSGIEVLLVALFGLASTFALGLYVGGKHVQEKQCSETSAAANEDKDAIAWRDRWGGQQPEAEEGQHSEGDQNERPH